MAGGMVIDTVSLVAVEYPPAKAARHVLEMLSAGRGAPLSEIQSVGNCWAPKRAEAAIAVPDLTSAPHGPSGAIVCRRQSAGKTQ